MAHKTCMEIVMKENIAFKYRCDDFESFCLHDAVVSSIIYYENYVDFYFENGLTIVKSETQTKDALIRVKVKPEDINVYLSTPQKNFFSHTENYKTKNVSLEQISTFLDKVDKIEIIDCMVGFLNSSIWRCVSLNSSRKHSFNYFEIQFNPISRIEYDIFYN